MNIIYTPSMSHGMHFTRVFCENTLEKNYIFCTSLYSTADEAAAAAANTVAGLPGGFVEAQLKNNSVINEMITEIENLLVRNEFAKANDYYRGAEAIALEKGAPNVALGRFARVASSIAERRGVYFEADAEWGDGLENARQTSRDASYQRDWAEAHGA